jgi:hypothetical protein
VLRHANGVREKEMLLFEVMVLISASVLGLQGNRYEFLFTGHVPDGLEA